MMRFALALAFLAAAGASACGFSDFGKGAPDAGAAMTGDMSSGNGGPITNPDTPDGATFVNVGDSGLADASTLPGEVLKLASMAPPPNVDLEAEGTLGWVHWGRDKNDVNSRNEKSVAVGAIPNFSYSGTNASDFRTYTDNLTHFAWTNGTPTPTETDTQNGVYLKTGTPMFTIKRVAGMTLQRLVVYAGVYKATGRLSVTLGAGKTISSDLDTADHGYGKFAIDFRAIDLTSQLVITWQMIVAHDKNNGNVTLAAATLMPGTP